MPLSLNNRRDIVADSISINKGNETIDLADSLDAILGLAPEGLNSLGELATALGDKADKSTTYTRTVTNNLLDAKVDDTEMVNYFSKTVDPITNEVPIYISEII